MLPSRLYEVLAVHSDELVIPSSVIKQIVLLLLAVVQTLLILFVGDACNVRSTEMFFKLVSACMVYIICESRSGRVGRTSRVSSFQGNETGGIHLTVVGHSSSHRYGGLTCAV